jgi:hypothetical protein
VAARQKTLRSLCRHPLRSHYNEALAQLALAAALLATDCVVPRAEIESALERAEHLVASIEGSALSPRILELRGRLAAAVGDAPSSDRTLREALDLDLYRAIGATGHAERLARELETRDSGLETVFWLPSAPRR